MLDIEELPRYKKGSGLSRKRKRDDSIGPEEEENDGKKTKMEGEESMDTTPVPGISAILETSVKN